MHRRKITADATKRGRSGIAAKRSGDLLLNFHHPKIPLREIVRKWQSKVVEKGQHLICPLQQVIEQVLGSALFLPPATFGHRCLGKRRLGRIAHELRNEVVEELISNLMNESCAEREAPRVGGGRNRGRESQKGRS
jgi:hypothetical protein